MTVITIANFKGGTSKTTTSLMLAHTLAKRGFKVLLIDKDPQANATSVLLKTHEINFGEQMHLENFLLEGLEIGDLSTAIETALPNLDFIPNSPALAKEYDYFLEKKYPGSRRAKEGERIYHFKKALGTLPDEYDFILIDVPPTISTFTDAALVASDEVIIALETHEFSLDGSDVFVDYLAKLSDMYELDLEVLGVLCVLIKNRSVLDLKAVEDAKELFGDVVFDTQIKYMERVKRYNAEGIYIDDHHDKNVANVYNALTNEILERLGVLVSE